MSSIDRFTNLAKGVLADGQKRLEAGGGLSGAARRVGRQAREAALSAKEVVEDGLTSLTEDTPPDAVDPELAAAREEVDGLRAAPRTPTSPRASAPVSSSDPLSRELEALDVRLRTGAIDRATWEAERTVVLDAADRASAQPTPRRRTL